MNRRSLLLGLGLAGLAAGAGWQQVRNRNQARVTAHECLAGNSGMRLRAFGATGMKVSEVGFGSWGIGGKSYGAVERAEALRALARAEELGCNFVDTAPVYGDSEQLLGEFMQGRRSRWIIATKYSDRKEGMTATVERQLANLRTDVIDFYQIHWVPRGADEPLFEELSRLKQAGKVRCIGVSLYTANDIDAILARPEIDGFQVACNLLEPDPFMARLDAIRAHNKGIIVRSVLREGFLTGKFKPDVIFSDPADRRSKLSRAQIETLVYHTERFRFLEAEAGSMVNAAARYPLSFPQVSTVILGTKSVSQAQSNFGAVPGVCLSAASLGKIRDLQVELGLGDRWPRLLRRFGLRG